MVSIEGFQGEKRELSLKVPGDISLGDSVKNEIVFKSNS